MTVALSGEIDVVSARAARDALGKAVTRAVTGVTVDLAEVTFMDAAGLGALADAYQRARSLPDGLRLAAVPPRVMRLLQVTGLDQELAGCLAPARLPERASRPVRAVRP